MGCLAPRLEHVARSHSLVVHGAARPGRPVRGVFPDTNAGNKAREQMAALIQQDLPKIMYTLPPTAFRRGAQELHGAFQLPAAIISLMATAVLTI